jgi:hypothetical protein
MPIRVRPKKDKKSYSLLEELYTPERRYNPVTPHSYPALGFDPDWTYEQALKWAKILNTDRRKEIKTITAAARRAEDATLVDAVYLPAHILTEFETVHIPSLSGSSSQELTLLKRWSTCKKVLVELKLPPKQYLVSKERFFKEFERRMFSADYSNKLIWLMNKWGEFYSIKTDSAFQKIPRPRGNQLQIIKKANTKKVGRRKKSKPITWKTLKDSKSNWEIAGLMDQWNWLAVALWFALRPLEVDSLTADKRADRRESEDTCWMITASDQHDGIMELRVQQTKLMGLAWEERWKRVPVYFQEQKDLVAIIESGKLKRPLVKTIRTYLKDEYDTYSPRKGATDNFLGLGVEFADASIFLGHHSVNQTWSAYKDKKQYQLPRKTKAS